ncbi:MAG: PAS domain-containing protein [Chloroflexi bacterium]|nr:PAS domain-containing protein [Chloroflexota bacterium]
MTRAPNPKRAHEAMPAPATGDEELAAARGRLLTEVAVLLSGGEPLESLCTQLPGLLARAIPFDYIELIVATATYGHFDVVFAEPALPARPPVSVLRPDHLEPLTQYRHLIQQYRPSSIDGSGPNAFNAAGLKRMAGATLLKDGKVHGLLTLGRFAEDHFAPAECEFLKVVGMLLAQAVESRERLARAHAEAARNRLLNELSILVNAGEPIETLFDRVSDLLAGAIAFDRVGFVILDAEGRRLVRVKPGAGEGEPGSTITFEEAGIEAVLASPELVVPYTLPEVPRTPFDEELRARGVKRGAVVLLRHAGQTFGMVHVTRYTDVPFSADDVAFLEVVATLIAQAIAAERRRRDAEREATGHRLLNELALIVNAGEPLAAGFDRIADLVRQAADVDVVCLAAGDGDGDLEVVGAESIRLCGGRERISLAESGMARIRDGGGTIAEFRSDRQQGHETIPITEGLVRGISALLMDGPTSIGVLMVGRRTNTRFSARDKALVEVIAALLARAAATLLRIRRTNDEADEHRILAELTATAAAEPEPTRLVAFMNRHLQGRFPGIVVGYGFIEGETTVYPNPRTNTDYRQPFDRYTREALAAGQVRGPFPNEKAAPDNPVSHFALYDCALTASRAAGRDVGLLLMAMSHDRYTFSARDLRFFSVIAQVLGPAMAASREAAKTARERALYNLALDSLSDAVLLIDHDLRAVFANPAGRRLIDSVRTKGRTLAELMPRLGPETRQALRAALDGGLRSRCLTPIGVPGGEEWFDVEAIPLDHPLYRLLIVATDVTVRRRREAEERRHQEELEHERSLYRVTLESLSEAVVLIADHPSQPGQLEISYANPAGRALGRRLNPTGMPVADRMAALPPELRGPFVAALEGREVSSGRSSMDRDDGRRWYEWEMRPLDRAPLRMLFVANDVTSEVEREAETLAHRAQMEQAGKLAALGELIGGVAHELNNPLTAILGFAEVIANSAAGPAVAEELGIIQKEALRARNVVRDLLFMARPGVIERGDVDLREILHHAERLRRAAWAASGIAVSIDCSGVKESVWANGQQLTQVLLNLVSNAEIAVAGRERPAIALSATTTADEATITVADNGRGMDAQTQTRIFEPFYTTQGGTGLGLSLSYSMVASHNGRIEVEAHPGDGARFTVRIPLRAEPAAQPPELAAPRAMRFLVVDDDASVRNVCRRLITSMGHECVTSTGSRGAAEAAATGDFDVVLCDYRLSGETANDVLAAFEHTAPQLIERTVLVTGATTDPGVIDLVERRKIRVLPKPYGSEDIAALAAGA